MVKALSRWELKTEVANYQAFRRDSVSYQSKFAEWSQRELTWYSTKTTNDS
ncbi:unnamed protein product [Penicillium roqueforti FM164]|uniref:Genomic scaffold, ProqFM164S01 n=1 Tax=Penicillium roqueforti (strain FM164) TaxID=1365484 RepID=W6QFK7_PENRF|nr:unnamed protein product [Penicillium roqueforti FM164]